MFSQKVTRREVLGGALAFLALAGLSGCNDTPEQKDGQQGNQTDATSASSSDQKVLKMGIGVDPDGLDPQRTAAAATLEITANLYDTLVEVTVDGDIIPALAKSWDVSEDGLTLTFTLQDGVTFSNGNPCDANACVASFERLLDPASPKISQYSGYTFEALDKTTLAVHTKTLNVSALSDFAYAWAAVVDVTAGEKLSSQPVGTGPYKLDVWTPQQKVVLVRNEKYWGQKPDIDRIEFTVLPDSTSQLVSLRKGEIDLLMGTSEQVEALQDDTTFQFIQAPQNGVQLMAMNSENKALADVRVRKAINYAVNKQELIDSVWWGQGIAIGSHYPVMLKGYIDCSNTYPYDPEKAKTLLKEAGYENGLTLNMRLPKDYQMYVDAGQIIADALKKVGITCKVEILEWAAWLDEVYTGRKYDLTVVGHTGRLDPITLLARYESTSSENYMNFSNEELDKMLAQYRTELDEEKRIAIVQDIETLLAQEVPALYIQDPITTYIAAQKVQGFAMYPIDIYQFKYVTLSE